MMRGIAFLVAMILISGCAVPPEIQMPIEPPLPRELGQIRAPELEGYQCPKVDGVYRNDPTVYEISNKGGKFIEGDPNDFFGLMSFHLATRKEELVHPESSRGGVFRLYTGDKDNFRFEFLAKEVGKHFSYEFSRNEGDFDCQDGSLSFPTITYYGGGEFTNMNVQSRVKIQMLESGSLLVIKSYGPYRSRNKILSDSFTYQYFRYRRAN